MSEERNEYTPEINEEHGEFSPELVELEDLETGEKHPFEILDALEVDGQEYIALVPAAEDPTGVLDDNCELVILKSNYISDDEVEYNTIEDDEEYERIGELFLQRLEEIFEGDDCDCDDCCDGGCDCCGHDHE
ncbi:MAG: DUF1292 domain-containing protein [Ruminococcus sp.]|nr:DUF1292 domain-containing protein [Ruminococcus sp.]MBQ8906322.1 DUF1292 domain-containing protein [Ruminococcus sp.]